MGAKRVLVTVVQLYKREAPYLRRLEEAGLEPVRKVGTQGKLTEDELIEALPGVFATLASSEPYTERVFRSASDLRIVSRWGVGYDAVDVPAATRHGVAVCTAVGANHEAVADYAVALMCALQRGLLQNHRMITSGQWRTEFRPGLWRATVGIVGLGRIGRAVARRCRGFEMRILYYDERRNEQAERELGVTYAPMDRLLAESDFVSLHVPLMPTTRHLIDAAALRKMKKTAVLINTSRGPVVDERALAEALRDKVIAAAGLDVYEREPEVEPLLLELENVVLLPHVASASGATRTRMAVRAAENILAFMDGKPLLDPVP